MKSFKVSTMYIVLSVSCLFLGAVSKSYALVKNARDDHGQKDTIEINSGKLSQQKHIVFQEDSVLSQLKFFQEPKFAKGEVIVKLKQGKTLADLDDINVRYRIVFAEKLFKTPIPPEARLNKLKDNLFGIEKKASKSLSPQEKICLSLERNKISRNINALEKLIAHLGQRQRRAPHVTIAHNLENVYLLKTNNQDDVRGVVSSYTKHPAVEYAEPNYAAEIQMLPDDLYYSSSGAWGQDYDDLWGLKKINAEEAWDISQGEGVIVAVVDTGLDYFHEDIANNVYINIVEIPDNGIDDDQNGYVDDYYGYNFADSYEGHYVSPFDYNGHGSHVSGIIAAEGNNGKGIIGISPKAKIMIAQGLMSFGIGFNSDLAEAICYAVDNGADIINNSWAGYGISQLIIDAVQYAYKHGCVVVAAGGNGGCYVVNMFPATLDEVISVGAVDHLSQKSDFSNYGDKIAVAAPGGDSYDSIDAGMQVYDNVLSLRAKDTDLYDDQIHIVDEQYYRARGTSMASPYVAGACALILSKYFGISNQEVEARLEASAMPVVVHDGYKNPLGAGIVDAYAMLNVAPQPWIKFRSFEIKESKGDGDQIYESHEEIVLVVEMKNLWKDTSLVTAELSWIKSFKTDTSIESIPVSKISYGAMATGEIKRNAGNPFIFKIGEIRYETPVMFRLSVVTDGVKQAFDFKIDLGIRRITSNEDIIDTGITGWRREWPVRISGDNIIWADLRNFYGFESPDDNTYLEDIYLYNIKTNQKRLVVSGINAPVNHPNFDISGNKIVWIDGSDGFSLVHVYDLNTDSEEAVNIDSFAKCFIGISGNQVVFLANKGEAYAQVYYYDLKTSKKRRLSNSLYNKYELVISGNKVVWLELGNGEARVCLYDLIKNKEFVIDTWKLSGVPLPVNTITVSVSGDIVVYQKVTSGRSGQVVSSVETYNIKTKMRKTIRKTAGVYMFCPVVFGDAVIWQNYNVRNSSYDINAYDVNSGKISVVTVSQTYAPEICPSISGDKLVWLDGRNNRWDIYTAELSKRGK